MGYWFTNRLPTEADADEDGEVEVQSGLRAHETAYFHWSMVKPGMAWTHAISWEGSSEPAPAAKPVLSVGQRWKRRDGEVVKVDLYDSNHRYGATHPFWAAGASYTADGIFRGDGKPASGFDLVELIEPATEPEPATTPRRFASISRTVWMDHGGSQCHTLDAIADDGTAWWMVPGETEWQELPALPDREAS
jgi:hypothetical protein